MKNAKVIQKTKTVHRHIKTVALPHEHNQFRPHLIRRHGLAVVLFVVMALVGASNFATTGSVLGSHAKITSVDLASEINKNRVRNDLPPLKIEKRLSEAAFSRAQDMIKNQYWSHIAPDGSTPWRWIAEADYNYAFAGENLAKNFLSSSATVDAWMASKDHRDNVLGPQYSEVGFAVVDGMLNGEQTTLIVALFAKPAESVAGVVAPVQFRAPVGELSIMSQFGVALQTLNPAVLSSVIVLMFVSSIALMTHIYRRRLPAVVQQTWRYHHGLIKASGLMVLAILIVALYSGGQI